MNYPCGMSRNPAAETSRTFVRYLPVNARMRAWAFAVTNVGHSMIIPGGAYPPMRHPSHHHFTWATGRVLASPSFIYITQGQGLFESASAKPAKVTAGDILVLFPSQWHRYKPDSETGWHEYWLDFEGSHADHLFKLAGFDPGHPVISIGLDEALIVGFTTLIELARTEPFRMEILMSAEAMRILCRITALMETRQLGTPQDAAAISKAKALLLEHPGAEVNLQELAATLGMSYTSFRRLFKASTGFSPRHFQLEHRLHRAQAMLSHSTLSVGEISEATGFESLFYFSQFFKKKTGVSPLTYRRHSTRPHVPRP